MGECTICMIIKMIKLFVFWKETHIHNTREEETSRNVEPIYLIQKLRKMKKSNRFTLLLSFYYLS